jgi:hypothetical protein
MPKLRSHKDNKEQTIQTEPLPDSITIKSENDNKEQATQTEPLPYSLIEYDLIVQDGIVYSGELKNGKYDGLGMMYGNGNVYYGEWKNGWSTHGKMTFINGDVYSGEFENGKYHGKGTFTWSNGDILDGIWENGLKVRGKLTFSDKRPTRIINKYDLYVICYEGEMTFLPKKKNVLFNGMGKVTLSNGNTFEGLFIDGMIDNTRHGKYIITKTNEIFEVSIETILSTKWYRQSY